MKVQIRQGVFETNSSSLHSLTIIPISKWDKWGKGELLMDGYVTLLDVNALVTPEEAAIRSKQYIEDGMDPDEVEESFKDREEFIDSYSTEWEVIPHPDGDLVAVSAMVPENELW